MQHRVQALLLCVCVRVSPCRAHIVNVSIRFDDDYSGCLDFDYAFAIALAAVCARTLRTSAASDMHTHTHTQTRTQSERWLAHMLNTECHELIERGHKKSHRRQSEREKLIGLLAIRSYISYISYISLLQRLYESLCVRARASVRVVYLIHDR